MLRVGNGSRRREGSAQMRMPQAKIAYSAARQNPHSETLRKLSFSQLPHFESVAGTRLQIRVKIDDGISGNRTRSAFYGHGRRRQNASRGFDFKRLDRTRIYLYFL